METSTGQEYSFHKMEPHHGRAVGILHTKYIKNSLLSDLGVDVLEPLYGALLDSGYGHGYVLMIDDRIAGFNFGRSSRDVSITQAVLRGWRRMALPLISYVLRHPLMAPKILKRINETGHVPCEPGVGEYMSMAIEKDVRGGEPSVMITELFFEDLKREGCRAVRWETMDFNKRAQKYFVKIKGTFIGESEVSGDKVFWYERDLTS